MRAAEQARLVSEILEGKSAAQSRMDLNLIGGNSSAKSKRDRRRDPTKPTNRHPSAVSSETDTDEADDTPAVFKLESDK